MLANSVAKEETPKKSKLQSNRKSSSSRLVTISDDSEAINNFIPKSKQGRNLMYLTLVIKKLLEKN